MKILGRETTLTRAWHPFAWAAYLVLWLYSENADEALPSELIWPIAAALTLTFVLGRLLRRDLKSPGRRAVVLSALIVVLLGYGPLEHNVRRLLLNTFLSPWLDHLRLFLSTVLLVLLFVLVRAMRTEGDVPRTTRFLNVAAGVCLVLATTHAAWVGFDAESAPHAEVDPVTSTAAGPEEGTDIFLIMLDAYAGVDALRDYYQYDNTPFLDALESRGFFVARQAHGNYQWTLLSLTSMLNMRYALEPETGPRMLPVHWTNTEHNLRPEFLHNRVCADLEARGYRTTAFETPVSAVQLKSADNYLSPGRSMSEFQRTCLEMTFPVSILEEAGIPIDGYLNDAHRRRRIRYVFETLPTLGGESQPVFVMAHVMCPHPPFLFKPDGSANTEGRTWKGEEYRTAYIDQLQYVSALVLDAVDAIHEQSPDAIIVVQSDHGARYPGVDRKAHPTEYAREYLSSLNAVYVPNRRGYDGLSPNFSQVNTFRLVFNVLFGADLPYEPDVSYLASPDDIHLYVPVQWEGYKPVFESAAE